MPIAKAELEGGAKIVWRIVLIYSKTEKTTCRRLLVESWLFRLVVDAFTM